MGRLLLSSGKLSDALTHYHAAVGKFVDSFDMEGGHTTISFVI